MDQLFWNFFFIHDENIRMQVKDEKWQRQYAAIQPAQKYVMTLKAGMKPQKCLQDHATGLVV